MEKTIPILPSSDHLEYMRVCPKKYAAPINVIGNVPDYIVKGGNTYELSVIIWASPQLVIDAATEAVAQRMDYDEFGNVILDSNRSGLRAGCMIEIPGL